MAIYATRAIILGRYEFGEADRILVVLTPERGVIRVVAKGVRRIKSRLAGHLELFSESELMLAEGKGMDTVTSARLQRHIAVSDDYDRMRLAYLCAEMVNRLAGETEPSDDGLFQLLREAYGALAERTGTVLELWFKLRLLDRLGYRPQLDACVVCGADDAARSYHFNSELGGIVDAGCTEAGTEPMTHQQIKLWRLMLTRSLASIAAIEGVNALAATTLPICNHFYDYTFGKRFRSAELPA